MNQHLLVVEDSRTQAEMVRADLESAGFTVTLARTGEEALALLRGPQRVNLVLSDVVMPGISGYEVCRRIKQELGKPDLPVVLLTSLSDPLDIIRGLECGADNYITKPYEPHHLFERVQHVLANREIRRTARPGDAVDIVFLGEKFTITAGKEQILDLLVSSYEELVRTNRALAVRTREAEQAREEAEAASRAKSEFLAMMSHELRTPLNAISGYAQLLEDEIHGPVTEAQRRGLQRIRRNQEHLLALITDILNFAKLESGRLELELAPLPVDATLASAEELVRPQLAAKGLTYEYRRGDPRVTVAADRERVLQIVVNLLTNAVKFTEPGGRVTLGWEARDGVVLVRVTDTGIGIPPEKLQTIFEPFVQLEDRKTSSHEGVGLGLAISRELARRMGGDLTAESQPGVGSTFTLRLPADSGLGIRDAGRGRVPAPARTTHPCCYASRIPRPAFRVLLLKIFTSLPSGS